MSQPVNGSGSMENPVSGTGGMTPERAVQVVILGALGFLVLVNRGFRGISIGNATGGLVK